VAEAHLTQTNRVVFHFSELKNINYVVLLYLYTGAAPCKVWADEWAEELLSDGEI
jgi:hypothetical protein